MKDYLSRRDKSPFLFIHGGPGLNSEPEKHLMAPIFKKYALEIDFWNEPTQFHSNQYAEEVQRSLIDKIHSFQDKVNIIAHSYGAKTVLGILSEVRHKIDHIFFSAPVVDTLNSDRAVLSHGYSVLSKTKNSEARELENLLPNICSDFDQTKQRALTLAFKSGFYKNYFKDLASFENYYQYFQDDHSFSMERYLRIRQTELNEYTPPDVPYDISCTLFYGGLDPVFSPKMEARLLNQYFSHITTYILPEVSHYPHMDASPFFMKHLIQHIKNPESNLTEEANFYDRVF